MKKHQPQLYLARQPVGWWFSLGRAGQYCSPPCRGRGWAAGSSPAMAKGAGLHVARVVCKREVKPRLVSACHVAGVLGTLV